MEAKAGLPKHARIAMPFGHGRIRVSIDPGKMMPSRSFVPGIATMVMNSRCPAMAGFDYVGEAVEEADCRVRNDIFEQNRHQLDASRFRYRFGLHVDEYRRHHV
jgi:hypothetical protein